VETTPRSTIAHAAKMPGQSPSELMIISLSRPPANNCSILTVCPKSDLSILAFQTFVTSTKKSLALSADGCAILTNGSETCIKDYNFPFAGTSVYNPLSLPTGIPGTDALYNTQGNAFSAFPSAAVVTLSLAPSYTSTITPASFMVTASADPQSISGTAILGGPTIPSSSKTIVLTGTASAATASATKASSGMKMEGNSVFLLLAAIVAIMGM
jgi:hypothetical protein